MIRVSVRIRFSASDIILTALQKGQSTNPGTKDMEWFRATVV